MLKSNSNIQYAFADPFYHRQYSHQHRWTQQAPQYYNKVGHRALSCYKVWVKKKIRYLQKLTTCKKSTIFVVSL